MTEQGRADPRGRALLTLALVALGVVYGDIGTSPLYALKECFSGLHSIPPTPENVIGVLSLVVWSLNFVVSFKYITFVLKADNHGEGGILALLALVRPLGKTSGGRRLLITLGLFGAALLYGDGVITPAISVLGAVEGLSVATPAFKQYVWPMAVVILSFLFFFQRHGTARVGRVFGPIMALWFTSIALLGLRGILMEPGVLKAVNPWYAYDFFVRDGVRGFLILGSVVLVLTGAEALYADMGHFGRRPIRRTWFAVVLPCLLLNYFGQSALLLVKPSAANNPFFSLVPGWGLFPMVAIATAAAIVASQALISGAFSLTRQAVQLGYSPRVTIVHTSKSAVGQIYIPEVNTALWIGCVALVAGFQSSSSLAAAYGIAVTGTMIITTLLFHAVTRDRWQWRTWQAGGLTVLFLSVDLAFFCANLVKIGDGGWFPLVVAGVIYTLMTTWYTGRARLSELVRDNTLPLDLFLADVAKRNPPRVPGIAVFLTSIRGGAPPVLLHHLKHNKMLHERVILMSVVGEEIPQVDESGRVACRELGEGFCEVVAHYGFMETPDVPAVLRSLELQDGDGRRIRVEVMATSFYLGRETLIPLGSKKLRPVPQPAPTGGDQPSGPAMARWRKKLFVIMTRNAQSATAFFGLPPNRVVELGAQIQF
jgi:KUP system potassium uptake protein